MPCQNLINQGLKPWVFADKGGYDYDNSLYFRIDTYNFMAVRVIDIFYIGRVYPYSAGNSRDSINHLVIQSGHKTQLNLGGESYQGGTL